MGISRRLRRLPLHALGAILLAHALVTGCSDEADRSAPGGGPSQAAGPAITKAGINPPSGEMFTSWIKGSGFQSGDKILVDGSTEIPTTFGGPELVTFTGPVKLLEGRTGLTVVVVRPGTRLRSNPVEAPIFSPRPKS